MYINIEIGGGGGEAKNDIYENIILIYLRNIFRQQYGSQGPVRSKRTDANCPFEYGTPVIPVWVLRKSLSCQTLGHTCGYQFSTPKPAEALHRLAGVSRYADWAHPQDRPQIAGLHLARLRLDRIALWRLDVDAVAPHSCTYCICPRLQDTCRKSAKVLV